MQRLMRIFMVLMIFGAMAVLPVRAEEKAADAASPQATVNGAVQKVLALLKDDSLKAPEKADERRQKIRTVLLELVDMDTVGALTLATYKSKFSPEQFAQFKEEFSNLLFKTYIANLEKYTSEDVVILKTEKLSDVKSTVVTKIKSPDKEIPVDFSMAQKSSGWVLYDVKVEGISMVQNYREQFRELLGKMTVDKFLERLKERREKGE
jgi:phospholipid transport system substrate-binding protein